MGIKQIVHVCVFAHLTIPWSLTYYKLFSEEKEFKDDGANQLTLQSAYDKERLTVCKKLALCIIDFLDKKFKVLFPDTKDQRTYVNYVIPVFIGLICLYGHQDHDGTIVLKYLYFHLNVLSSNKTFKAFITSLCDDEFLKKEENQAHGTYHYKLGSKLFAVVSNVPMSTKGIDLKLDFKCLVSCGKHLRQLSYYFKNTYKEPHDVPPYTTIFDARYLRERNLVDKPMMDAWNESEVDIKSYIGYVADKYLKNKQDFHDLMNGDRSTSIEQRNKKSKVTHVNNDKRAQTMLQSFFYAGLRCIPKSLFQVTGSENTQMNFYYLMEDFSEMKAIFDISLLDEVYPSKIIHEKDLREIMQKFSRENSDETQRFVHLVTTFIGYALTVCGLKPNMAEVNSFFCCIENWLRALYKFENHKNFAIPISSAVSSFKTSLSTLIDISNIQPKDLPATDMDCLYKHCGCTVALYFHRSIAEVKDSFTKEPWNNETDEEKTLVCFAVRNAILTYKEKNGIDYWNLAHQLCLALHRFFTDCFNEFKVECGIILNQLSQSFNEVNDAPDVSESAKKLFDFYISEVLPISQDDYITVHKNESKELKNLRKIIQDSKEPCTNDRFKEILQSIQTESTNSSLNFTLVTAKTMKSYLDKNSYNKKELLKIVKYAIEKLGNCYGRHPQQCNFKFLDTFRVQNVVSQFIDNYPTSITFEGTVRTCFNDLFGDLKPDGVRSINTKNAEQYEGQYIEKEKSARRIINPSDNDSLNPYKDNGDALVSDALKAFATAYRSIFFWKTDDDLVEQVKRMHNLIQQVGKEIQKYIDNLV